MPHDERYDEPSRSNFQRSTSASVPSPSSPTPAPRRPDAPDRTRLICAKASRPKSRLGPTGRMHRASTPTRCSSARGRVLPPPARPGSSSARVPRPRPLDGPDRPSTSFLVRKTAGLRKLTEQYRDQSKSTSVARRSPLTFLAQDDLLGRHLQNTGVHAARLVVVEPFVASLQPFSVTRFSQMTPAQQIVVLRRQPLVAEEHRSDRSGPDGRRCGPGSGYSSGRQRSTAQVCVLAASVSLQPPR